MGDWPQPPIPNPQSPIPNPHPNIKNNNKSKKCFIMKYNNNRKK
jgi:hypothetical protein